MKIEELRNRPSHMVVEANDFAIFCESEKNEEDCAIERFQQIWQKLRSEGGTKETQLEKLVDALDDACEIRSQKSGNIIPDDIEDDDTYCSLPGNAGEAVVCSNSARFLQKIVGGKVLGFWAKDNPGTSMEELADGHDFLLVNGRYIVDYWVKKIEGVSDRAVLDLQRHADRKIARKMYGLKSKWKFSESALADDVEDPNWEEKIYKKMPEEVKKSRRLNRKMREADRRYRDKRMAKLKKDLGAIKGERVTLSSDKIVYHGSPADTAKKIAADGFLKSNEVEKASSGGMEESGLIWFATSEVHAASYARGEERRKGPKHGAIFAVTLPAGTKLINRYATLTDREAQILDKGNKRRSYDPIRGGITLSSAMSKLYQHPQSIRTYGEVLPLLGFDGIHYGNGFQIGVAKKEFAIESMTIVGEET